MSVTAIAAALAREGLSAGERLVAFSLASFADRENRAWPGAPAAAARAGLSRAVTCKPAISSCAAASSSSKTLRLVGACEHAQIAVRGSRPVVRARDQRAAVRGGARVQPRARPRAAALGDDGCARERGPRCGGSHDRAAVQRCGAGRQELPARAAGAARVRRARAAQRCRRARKHKPLGDPRPAAARGEASRPAARRDRPRRARGRSFRAGHQRRPAGAASDASSRRARDPTAGHDQPLVPRCRRPANRPVLEPGVSGEGGQDQNFSADRGEKTPAGAKPRQKPRHPTRARERNPRTPEPKNTPPTPLKGGARRDSITIEETYTTGAAEVAAGGSTSTSTRSAARSAYRGRVTSPTGRGFGSCWPKPSARAPSRSGSSPSG